MIDSNRMMVPATAIRSRGRAAVAAVQPLRVIRDSWWLALVAVGLLQQVHIGLHEHRELSPLVHLLRDAALAVPAAAIAILVASILIAARTSARAVPRPPGIGDRLLWVGLAVVVFAFLSVPGNALHGALFGAEEEAELSWLADVALDAGVALVGAIVALVPLAAVAGLPIGEPGGDAAAQIDHPRPVLETLARSSQ
jgi:hypothetical protein